MKYIIGIDPDTSSNTSPITKNRMSYLYPIYI